MENTICRQIENILSSAKNYLSTEKHETKTKPPDHIHIHK